MSTARRTTGGAAAAWPADLLVVDGMAFRFGGWCDDLGRSGITAIIATVDDFVSEYAATRQRLSVLRAAIDADSRLALVLRPEDIGRAHSDGRVGIILAFQNANPIEDRLEYLDEFYALGLRSMQLTYNRRNRVGGGCLDPVDEGLSDFGRRVVARMNELGILVDLSHCGALTARQAIEASAAPVAFTHAGAAAVTPNPRNRADPEIRAVADGGGLIGLSAYGPFCWDPGSGKRPTLRNVLRHVDHVLALVGDEHIGFGGDWPVGISVDEHEQAKRTLGADAAAVIGAYNHRVGDSTQARYPVDMPSLAHASALIRALLADGHREPSVRRMVGGNFLRVFAEVWR